MSKNKELNYISAFSYLFKVIKPYKKWYLTAAAISLILVGTNLINTRITQMLVDSSMNGNFSKIMSSLIVFVLLILMNTALKYTSGICVSKLSANTSRDLKCHIAKTLLHADYKEIIKLRGGDTLSSVNSDTANVCNFIAGDFIGLFSQFTMAIGGLVYLIYVNPLLAVVTFVYTPIGMFFTLSLNNKMGKLYSVEADYKGEALSVVEQALSQIPVIKSFMMEKQIKNKIYEEYNKVYKTAMNISIWKSLMEPACSSTAQMPKVSYMIFAGYMVMRGHLTIGTFIAVFDLLDVIIAPSVYFPFMLNGLNSSIASINRISRLENIPQRYDTRKVSSFDGLPELKINDISFGYLENKPIINGFSMCHKGNGIIALCGESGAGKTTLLDIISGLYKPKEGSVMVNGTISVMSQETYIFSMSLMENIKIVRPKASDEEVIQALKLAGANEFAEALPNGYYTMLGEGNTALSGGQKQRISLARTILQNSSIWLLDEPTSALDAETESIVIAAITKVSKEKLIIMSAHRQSLISIADEVINLKGADMI